MAWPCLAAVVVALWRLCVIIIFLFFILPCLYAYLFIFIIPAAPFALDTVNIVDIMIPPIRVICIVLFCCTFRWASPLFHFTAHPVCVGETIKLLES